MQSVGWVAQISRAMAKCKLPRLPYTWPGVPGLRRNERRVTLRLHDLFKSMTSGHNFADNMADAAVENPLNTLAPHKKPMTSNIPNIDIEGIGNDDTDEYSTLKKLQGHLE